MLKAVAPLVIFCLEFETRGQGDRREHHRRGNTRGEQTQRQQQDIQKSLETTRYKESYLKTSMRFRQQTDREGYKERTEGQEGNNTKKERELSGSIDNEKQRRKDTSLSAWGEAQPERERQQQGGFFRLLFPILCR